MITIYWASGSPMAWPVQLALLEKGVPHDSRQLRFDRGENRTPSFLAMNPRGKVPVLRDGETFVYEARAVLDYLELRFPEVPLVPTDHDRRAIDLIRKNETAYVYPAADAAISYTSYSSTLKRGEWDLEHLAKLTIPLLEELARWDAYLEGRSWLAGGSNPTHSDLLLIPLLLYFHRFGLEYDARGFSNLAAYVDRACSRSSVRDTWPPHWKTSEGDPTFATPKRSEP